MHSTSFRLKTLLNALFSTALLLAFAPFGMAQAAEQPEGDPIPRPETETAVPASADVHFDAVANSVVKIFCTARYPDPYKPWTKQSPTSVTGSGVVIDGKRLLSNAHVVMHASQVQVQAYQSGEKIPATVEAISPGMDLAILKLDDESFFDTHPPLPRAESLPEVKDTVMVYGYPEGGTSLSITKGIVSRIDFTTYDFPASGLRIQIDAAINPGNSGGPATVGDRMVGLAFSRLSSAENIGYIIPTEEIELFLKDVADGRYDGKPGIFDDFQTLENPALRSFLKLDKSVQGLVVRKPDSDDAAYPLKQWDVVTKIGNTPVDDEGMIIIGNNLRVRFAYLVQKLAANGKVPLTIVRNAKQMEIELPVSTDYPLLIPDLGNEYPPYFIYGPIVFSKATEAFVRGFTSGNRSSRWIGWLTRMGSPLVTRAGDKQAFEGEELVVVPSPFLPHRLSMGYDEPYFQVVRTINEVPVKNLAHLVALLRDSKDEFIRIEFDARVGESIIFPRAQVLAATEDILNDNGIRSQGSPDTLAVWNEK